MTELFLSVNLFLTHSIIKIVCVIREFDRFFGTHAKITLFTEAVSKKPEHVVLQLGVKIYYYIPAQDEVHFSKNPICDQVVIGEDDIPL